MRSAHLREPDAPGHGRRSLLVGLEAIAVHEDDGGTAQAASVGVSVSSPDDVTFVAGSGETNVLNVDNFSPGLIVTDSGAVLAAGAG